MGTSAKQACRSATPAAASVSTRLPTAAGSRGRAKLRIWSALMISASASRPAMASSSRRSRYRLRTSRACCRLAMASTSRTAFGLRLGTRRFDPAPTAGVAHVPDDESRAEAARLVGLTRLALRHAAVRLNADGLDGLRAVRSPRRPRTQPGERVWLGLRQRFLWRRVLDDREMVTVCREARNGSCLKTAI